MSEDFLKNPLSLFDVSGKTAIVTGASGAFGALAAKVLAGAGANVVIAAGNAAELQKVAESCKKLGGKVEALAKRPSSEANCEAIVKAAVERFGRLDILVVASGINKVGKIVDQAAADFLEVIDANVTQSWLMARAAGRQMIKQSGGGKVILDVVGPGGLLRPSRRLLRLLRVEIGGRRHHQGARLRVGRDRHHRQCARPDGVSFAADSVDVRGQRTRLTAVRKGFLMRVPKGRLGEPSDLAGPLLFLASKASDFYTGHILYADGGYTAG